MPFLPAPRVLREADGTFRLETPDERPTSIGRVRAYQGSAGVLVRAYAYICSHGGSGLVEVSEDAVLAANYLKGQLAEAYEIPFDRPCKHEFVATARLIKEATGVRTLDIAKRLIDKGYHPPTIYFPLIVEECLLIEPTETESVETLDAFAAAMADIAREARVGPGAGQGRSPQRARPAPRRGHRRTAAGPSLARHDRRRDALPAVTGAGRRPAEPRSGRGPRLAVRADRTLPQPAADALPVVGRRRIACVVRRRRRPGRARGERLHRQPDADPEPERIADAGSDDRGRWRADPPLRDLRRPVRPAAASA